MVIATHSRRLPALGAATALLLATLLPLGSLAAGTDIATSPLANRRSAEIKPNIMLIFDDSGSMTSDAMPDSAETTNRFGPGRRSHLCNTIYYNPNPSNAAIPLSPYLVPRDHTGSELNVSDQTSFANAYDNGFWSYDQEGQTSGVAQRSNLSTTMKYGVSYPLNSLGQPAYYWTYLGSLSVTPSSAACTTPSMSTAQFSTATGFCGTSAADESGNYTLVFDPEPTDVHCAATATGRPTLIWKKVVVSATSGPAANPDERQRFANWYSYYRTRMSMAKSALGRAFLPLVASRKYRVGFITISPQQLLDGTFQSSVYGYNAASPYLSKFLEIRNFDSTDLAVNQPARWFNILYSQQRNGKTPLREGLSRVGRYYAGKNDGPNAGMIPSNTYDPVQYACQQNFSILTTDGYWDSPTGSIGGFKLDYTVAMDNQDGNIAETDAYGLGLPLGARPIWDGTLSQSGNLWDARNDYRHENCNWYLKTTNQALRTQSQFFRTTHLTKRTESTVTKSTSQIRQTTHRTQLKEKQLKKSTQRSSQETWQILKSTQQIQKTELQATASEWELRQTDYQDRQTSDVTKTVEYELQKRSRTVSKTTDQNLATTTVRQTTTVAYTRSTSSPRRLEYQRRETSSQVLQNTVQHFACNKYGLECEPVETCTPVTESVVCKQAAYLRCDGSGMNCVPELSCTAGAGITCKAVTNAPVSSCTAQSALAGNNWVAISCTYPVGTNHINKGVETCTEQTASNGNNWVTKSCSTHNPAAFAVASCTPDPKTSANNWFDVSCPAAVTSGPTPIPPGDVTCSITGDNGSCTVSGSAPDWVHTTYTKTTVKSASGTCTPEDPAVGNNYTQKICYEWSSGSNVPVATCTQINPGSAQTTFTAPVGLGYSGPTSGVWVNTVCAKSADSGTVNIIDNNSDCAASPPALGGTTTASYSGVNDTIDVPALSYFKQIPGSAVSYKSIYCTYPTGSTSANGGWPNSGDQAWARHTGPAIGCAPGAGFENPGDDYGSSPTYTHVQCKYVDRNPTQTASCSNQDGENRSGTANDWIWRVCSTGRAYDNSEQVVGCPSTGYDTGAKTGFTGPAGYTGPTGKVYVATSCSTSTLAGPTLKKKPGYGAPACACDPSAYDNPAGANNSCTVNASAGNGWTRSVCSRTFAGSTPVETCTAGVASSSPYRETICPTAVPSAAVGVASYADCGCDPGGGNTCTGPKTAPDYIARTCTGSTTTPTPVQNCGPVANPAPPHGTSVTDPATALNSWTSTTCTFSQPAAANYVSDCAFATGINATTTTFNDTDTTGGKVAKTYYKCTRTVTGDHADFGVVSAEYVDPTAPNSSCGCTPGEGASCSVAGTSPNWIHTRCRDVTVYSARENCDGLTETGPGTGVYTIAPAEGNNYKQSTCTRAIYSNTSGAINDKPVESCPSTGTTNGGLPHNNAWSTNFGSGVFGGSRDNFYYSTFCNTVSVDHGAVNPDTCGCTVAGIDGQCDISKSAGNSYTATRCSKTSVQTPVQTGTCTPVPASAPGWVATTCPVTTAGPTAWDPVDCGCTPGTNAACNVAGTNADWTDKVCSNVTSGPIPVGICNQDDILDGASTPPWSTTSCDTTSSPNNSSNVPAQTCSNVPGASAVGPDYLTVNCSGAIPGKKVQFSTRTQKTVASYSGGVLVSATPEPWGANSAWADFGQCSGQAADSATWPALPVSDTRPSGSVLTNPTLASFGAGCTQWPCFVTGAVSAGGSVNSLADVAQYYYKTDLRPSGATGYNGLDVSANIVPSSATDPVEGDKATWQHMTTFTMGLGVSGTVSFDAGYKNKQLVPVSTVAAPDPANPAITLPVGTPLRDFQRIRCQGQDGTALAVPPHVCKNWPVPAAASATAVDDLWHAAVNGRGQYFSAGDPDAVYTGLLTTLQAISAQSGAGTGSTTATQDPVAGNDFTFRAGFRTVDWTGDVRAQQLYTGDNPSLEGTTLPGTVWSAQEKLDGRTGNACDGRQIYLFRAGATNNLTPFTWNTYACDGAGNPAGLPNTGLNAAEQEYFKSDSPDYAAPFGLAGWTQHLEMTKGLNSSIDQRPLAQRDNLVNFLRGQRGMEGFTGGSATKLFRTRTHVLGDIVGSQPRYVKEPLGQFLDVGYASYKSAKAGRAPMIYVGANDGMLHAFRVGASAADPLGGTEAWAIVPSPVLPNLHRLADTGYADAHTYFVDSTPTAEDVYNRYATSVAAGDCATTTEASIARDCWRTIIVGGLGAGGRGYYAVDVTDPESPKGLWEFKWSNTCYDSANTATHSADCHLGLTFGLPLITKLSDNRWVVLVTSGINNTNTPSKLGDGQGYLYVLDAITGKILKKIGTGVGSGTTSVSTLTGTLTTSANSRNVVGTGTAFTTELVQGRQITINGATRYVQTITDNTHLTVSDAFATSGSSGATAQVGDGPAGLAYINAYVENYIQDNKVGEVYGGDMLGNVWRFKLKASDDHTDYVVRLARLVDANGKSQPVTTMPQLRNFGAAAKRMVFVGTGRYLGESDLSDTQRQTVYGLTENLNVNLDTVAAAQDYADNGSTVLPTSGYSLRQQLNNINLAVVSNSVETKVVGSETTTVTTVTTPVSGDATTTVSTYPTVPAGAAASTTVRSYANRGSTAVGCQSEALDPNVPCAGWYADLPDTGERVAVHPQLVLGTLVVPTNVTNLSACDVGGNSWVNFFDSLTGQEVPGSRYRAGRSSPGAVTVGISLIRGAQTGRVLAVLTRSDDTQEVAEVPTQQAAPLGRRASWRDLSDPNGN